MEANGHRDATRAAADDHETPLVSVVMPVYNTRRFVQEAIDSVLAQDYPRKELIVIDDGSTDGTTDLLRSYGDRLVLIEQSNQGAAVARNAGLDASRGEFVAFLDSDDVWLPGKLTMQVAHLLEHVDIGIVYGRWGVWQPDGNGVFTPPEAADQTAAGSAELVADGSGWLYNRLLFTSLLHTITVMARRRLIDEVGPFDPELKRGQDYDYWLRASRLTRIHQLDRVVALYRLHGDGAVKKWPYVNYEEKVVKSAFDRWGLTGPDGETTDPKAMRRRLADTCFSFGYHHYWEGDPRLALETFRRALHYRPWHAASWRYLALSAAKVGLARGGRKPVTARPR